jgi:hypothetical protein
MHIQPPTPIRVRVIRVRRGATASVTALACVALLSACGSSSSSSSTSTSKTNLNTARVAVSIEQSILNERKLHSKVVCPTAVPQEAGKTFECIATTTTTKPPIKTITTPFVVTIQNSKGYVTYVGK